MVKAPLSFTFYVAAPIEKVWNGFVSKETNQTIFMGADFELDVDDVNDRWDRLASADLWTVAGPVSSTSGSIDASITGNTFLLEVDAAEDPGLALVTERGQSTWTTFHEFGPGLGDQCRDQLR